MPNRILKDTICTSDTLDQLTAEEERFFYRLLVQCDDYGRFDARPQVIRAKCFPLKIDSLNNKQIEKLLAKLREVELITIYQSENKPYLQLKTWHKHQQIRAKKSKYPAFDGNESNLISNDINCNQMQANVPVIQSNPIQSESNPITTEKPGGQATLFEQFWQLYPKKKSKGRAEKVWARIKPDEQLYASIMSALERAKTSDDWTRDKGQYIPYPAKWLNERGWEDEYTAGPTNSRTEIDLVEAYHAERKRAAEQFGSRASPPGVNPA